MDRNNCTRLQYPPQADACTHKKEHAKNAQSFLKMKTWDENRLTRKCHSEDHCIALEWNNGAISRGTASKGNVPTNAHNGTKKLSMDSLARMPLGSKHRTCAAAMATSYSYLESTLSAREIRARHPVEKRRLYDESNSNILTLVVAAKCYG